jgi:Uma2 family endonuclease
MATETLISVEQYLATVYRPDCDYVDGQVLERNMGEQDHSGVQGAIVGFFYQRRKKWNLRVLPEQRVQVKADRFRIPDVCVILGRSEEQILTKPPFLCIEILSPEDRLSRVRERIDDFLAMGVPYVWLIARQAYTATAATGLCEVKSGILKTENPALEMPLSEIFE